MTPRTLLLALCLLARAVLAASPPPNIVFFLTDDLGIDGFGCYGSDRFKDKTPNVDRLAATGLRFDFCYSMPTCNPSRCALMTGRYEFHTGNAPSYKEEPSVARVLKQAGYATGMAGKWRQMRDTPGDWGFDEFLTDPSPSGYYWETRYAKNGAPLEAKAGTYGPDLCRDFAIDSFQRHKDAEKPFFFYYPTHLVHNPIVRTPQSAADDKDRDRLFADNVAYLDKQVGEIVGALDRLGLRERTVIVFASDNGTAKYGIEHAFIRGRHIYGMKETMFEGGSRVPLIVNWKGKVAPGRTSDNLIDFTDVLPTFAELGGAPLPASPALDGHSFAPQIRGEPGTPRKWVYVQHNTSREWYVLEHGWKLTQAGNLFDMSDAPFAEKPVSPGEPNPAAQAARERLQTVLDRLNPGTGKLAPEKGSAGLSKKAKKKKKKERAAAAEKEQAAPGAPAPAK